MAHDRPLYRSEQQSDEPTTLPLQDVASSSGWARDDRSFGGAFLTGEDTIFTCGGRRVLGGEAAKNFVQNSGSGGDWSCNVFRSTSLSPSHYAGFWAVPDEDQRNDLAAINQLGYAYGSAPDSDAKEAMLLQLLEAFHGYLHKYLTMIIKGTLPDLNSRSGRDAKEFLRMLAPRGVKYSPGLSHAICKMLHLAFKQQTTEEIYDTLAFCFMRAARRYDPFYTDKVKNVCREIDAKEEFTAAELAERVGLDPAGILRALVRKGFLSSVIGKKRKVISYRQASWPPPAEYLESGPVGFVFVVQVWFRYYLNEFIIGQMGEIWLVLLVGAPPGHNSRSVQSK